jgi:hypothetical protein
MRAIEGAGGSKWRNYQVEHEADSDTRSHGAKRYRGYGQIGPQVRANNLMFHCSSPILPRYFASSPIFRVRTASIHSTLGKSPYTYVLSTQRRQAVTGCGLSERAPP